MADTGEDRDFGAILAEFENEQTAGGGRDPRPGTRVHGRILSIGEETAFVDVGAKSDGVVARAELLGADGELTVGPGDPLDAFVTGRDEASGCLVLRVRPGAAGALGGGAAAAAVAVEEIHQAQRHGIPVEGTVTAAVKGGAEVTVAGLRAFCPISQLDATYVEDAAAWVGRHLSFLVSRFEPAGRGGRPNIVLSRRELLAREEAARRAEALARLEPGAVVRGTVTSVTRYGAFVDLGGVEGLLHVSEMSHGHVEDPAEVVAAGDSLEVKVLSIEEREGKGQRISLSRKALEADPWKGVAERFPAGLVTTGRVVRLEPYGAFVELSPGLEGLVHVSELAADRRVSHPREVVELGQDVAVRVLSVEPQRRRVALTLAAPAAEGEEASHHEGPERLGSLADFFER